MQPRHTSNSTSDIFLEEIESEIVEQFRLRKILEEACLVTGATGAAIRFGTVASIREHHRSGKALINVAVGSGLPLDQNVRKPAQSENRPQGCVPNRYRQGALASAETPPQCSRRED